MLWSPDGKIIDAAVNTPGSFHDLNSTLWCNIYSHIALLTDGYVVVCDLAFTVKGKMEGKLEKLKESSDGFAETEYEKSLTCLQQALEWGNGILLNSWQQLNVPLPTVNVKRSTILWWCILLQNFRTEMCDRNQIQTYYENFKI